MTDGVDEVRLADGAMIAFDGRVLEVFGQGNESRRIHVATIERFEASGSMLEIKVRGESDTFFGIEVDEAQRGALDALLSRVRASRPAEPR